MIPQIINAKLTPSNQNRPVPIKAIDARTAKTSRDNVVGPHDKLPRFNKNAQESVTRTQATTATAPDISSGTSIAQITTYASNGIREAQYTFTLLRVAKAAAVAPARLKVGKKSYFTTQLYTISLAGFEFQFRGL